MLSLLKLPPLQKSPSNPRVCRAEGESPASISGAGSVILLPLVGASLLSSLDAAPLAESRCCAQISSAVESQLWFGSFTLI